MIAFNPQQGVLVANDASIGNTIRGNSIHSNGGLGIDLGADRVTLNDASDADTGPNLLQNFPELKAVRAGATTLVNGTLRSLPNATFLLDFYANDQLDPTGYGEGRRWLGTIQRIPTAKDSFSFERNSPGQPSQEN